MTPTLAEDKRKQLDDIVGKMHTNGEPDENIQTVIGDFKKKYSVQAPPGMLDKVRGFLSQTGKGQYDPSKTFEFPKSLERAAMVGGLAEGGASLLKNPEPIMNLARAGYQGMKAALPQLKQGAIETGLGLAGTAALRESAPQLSHIPIWAGVLPGAKNLIKGVGTGLREFAGEFNPANIGKLFTSESTVPEAMGAKATIPGYSPGESPLAGKQLKIEERFGGSVKDPSKLRKSKPIGMGGPEEISPEKPLGTPLSSSKGVGGGEAGGTSRQILKPKSLYGPEGLLAPEPNIPGGYEKLNKIPGMRYGGPTKSIGKLKTSRPIGMSGPPEIPSEASEEGIIERSFEKPQTENLPPGHQAFLETEAPYRPPISQSQIEASQSTARAAKENQLARHLDKNFPDLTKIPKTSEFLKTVGKEAGLKWEPSLRTLEEAIKKANMLRINP